MEITKTVAKRIYSDSPDWFKEQLVSEFGEKTFNKQSFEDIKTLEDACVFKGIKPEDIVFNSSDTPDEIAYKKLKVVISAVNGNFVPDFNNPNQPKWFPVFTKSSGSGFVLSSSDSDCTYAFTYVGSRLCFESEEKSNYVAQQFIDLYNYFL